MPPLDTASRKKQELTVNFVGAEAGGSSSSEGMTRRLRAREYYCVLRKNGWT